MTSSWFFILQLTVECSLYFVFWKTASFCLQHLVWILGLKPSTGGSLKAGRTTTDSNAVITTAVMADLPVLSAMLSRLFESSQYLDDVALHHLIDALCKLSHEAMELAYSNRVREVQFMVCSWFQDLNWLWWQYCHIALHATFKLYISVITGGLIHFVNFICEG